MGDSSHGDTIAAGTDGDIWFTETATKKVGKLNPDSGSSVHYDLPDPTFDPLAITSDRNGGAWLIERLNVNGSNTYKIAHFSSDGSSVSYDLPAPYSSSLYSNSITADITGSAWFSSATAGLGTVASLTQNGQFSESEFGQSYKATKLAYADDGSLWAVLAGETTFVQKIAKIFLAPASTTLATSGQYQSSSALNWTLVEEASSYNIYRDAALLDSVQANSYVDVNAPEGAHQYYVTSVNVNGESEPSNTVDIYIDTSNPVLELTPSRAANADGWYNQGVNVTVTCTDPDSPEGVPGSGIQSCTPASNYYGTEGVHEIIGEAVDNAGNTVTKTLTIKIDTVAPTITFEAESNSWTNGTSVEYECVDGGTTTTNTAPIITNPDGSTTATGTCTDSAGNTTSETIPVQVDTGVPNTDYTVDSPTYNQATGWSRGPVTVTFTCSDPGGAQASGIASCSDPVTVTAEGTTIVTGTAVDVAGNSTQVNVFVNIDSVDPDITATVSGTQTNGWYTENATVTFTCTDATSGVANCPQPQTISAEGSQTVSGTATDVAGNTKTVSVQVDIDKTAPTIEYTLAPVANAQGWHNGNVLVTFVCADAASGVATCTDPVTVSAEGSTGVTGTATDNAGYTTEVLVFVNVDKTDPTISPNFTSANPQVNGWYTSDVTTAFVCDDALSGVLSCVGSEAAITTDGRYTVTGTAIDSADNSASTEQSVNLDKTAPILGIPAWTTNPLPAGGSTTIDVPAIDATSGIAQAEFFVGDTDPGVGNATPMTVANPWVDADGAVTSANLVASFGSTLQPGIYPITVRAQDAAGNWQLEVVDNLVVFDAAGPTNVAMSKKAVPKLADGDVLPGLLSDSQNGQADLAFDVAYTSTGTIDSLSNLTLDYANKQGCKNIKPGCIVTSFTASTVAPQAISWLTINGTGSSVGTFQGVGTLAVETDQGVTTTTNPFKVTATDGNRTTPVSSDTAVLYIYATGANPATATPLYQYHVSANGNWMKIQ